MACAKFTPSQYQLVFGKFRVTTLETVLQQLGINANLEYTGLFSQCAASSSLSECERLCKTGCLTSTSDMYWTTYIAELPVPTGFFPKYYCPEGHERYKASFTHTKAGKIFLICLITAIELTLLIILIVSIVTSAKGRPTFACCSRRKPKQDSVPLVGATVTVE